MPFPGELWWRDQQGERHDDKRVFCDTTNASKHDSCTVPLNEGRPKVWPLSANGADDKSPMT